MRMITCKKLIDWDVVYTAALATERKVVLGKHPPDKWKRKMLRSPHSPIRAMKYLVQFECEYFVQNHLVRHHEGVQWFVGSQRNDRQSDYDRRAARQDTPVMVTCIINGDALKFISRRRLCGKASPETREVWKGVVDAVCEIDPILRDFLVPECVSTGFCPEFKSCGFVDTPKFKEMLEKYRSGAK